MSREETEMMRNIASAYKEVGEAKNNEALQGDQHKLDHDRDGDIDAADFKGLRSKKPKKKGDQETGNSNPKLDAGTNVSKKETGMEQKESVRERLMSIWEAAADKKSPNKDKAEKPEDALTGQGAKDMMSLPKDTHEPMIKAVQDQEKAAAKAPTMKPRTNDQKTGDKKIIPSATPLKGAMEAYASMNAKG